MKSYRKELWFNIPARRAFVNITRQVEEALQESGIREGLVLVNAMHITASVFINDDESGLHGDYEKWRAGFWHLGADLLRRVRRPQKEEGAGKDHRRMKLLEDLRRLFVAGKEN